MMTAAAIASRWATAAEPMRRAVVFTALLPGDVGVVKHWRDRFAARGWVEGRNFRMEVVNALGRERELEQAAHEVVASRPDVILTGGLGNTRAMRAATRTIPIVFMEVSDPVASGLVSTLRAPGGNVTGATSRYAELIGKRFELLHELAPAARRVGLLMREGSFGAYPREAFAHPAARLGLALHDVVITDIAQARAGVEGARAEACYCFLGGIGSEAVVPALQDLKVPAVYAHHKAVEKGGLASLGEWWLEPEERAIDLAAKVLSGQNPGMLPIDQLSRPWLAVNLRTAAAIGVVVPGSLLVRANEVFR